MWTSAVHPRAPRTLDHVKQDPSLNDEALEGEIKLVGDLVLAASQSDGQLTEDQIDEILGILPDDDEADEDVAADG